ncbi:MAG: DUF72 domain-containing protein [Polyangiaceae bacterium]|nr:DUF72 domain-containing protein [Polyangiaceae bacterium]
MTVERIYLGCPSWGMKSWVGRCFPRGTTQTDFLRTYSRIFNSVEGNTTFYALPKADNVARWRDEVPDDFRFCFKFPKKVTHEKLLLDSAEYVDAFLERLAPLGPKLGSLIVQLPPRFGFKQLGRLGDFLRGLPKEFRYAVELRHPVFFAAGDEERAAADMFRELGVDTVVMDARGLHSSDNPELAEVRERKPDLPIVMRATGPQPIVRCVPHEDFSAGVRFVEPWIEQLSKWIAEGKRPYFFMHAPDDTYAPDNAYRFHRLLSGRVAVGDLPPWAGKDDQLGLF